MAELHADLFSRHASPLEAHVFVAVDEKRGEDVNHCVRRDLSSMQRKTRRRGGRRKVYSSQTVFFNDFALLFETFIMHVSSIRKYYVRPNIFGEKKKSSPEVRSRDEDVEKCVCAKIQGLSLKTGVGIRTVVRKTCVFYVVA